MSDNLISVTGNGHASMKQKGGYTCVHGGNYKKTGKRKINEVVRVELDYMTRKRYILDKENRILKIDMRGIGTSKQFWTTSRLSLRKFCSPLELQAKVDEYFESCNGVLYNPKTGQPYLDKDGMPVIGQIKPYTLTGLQLHLDLIGADWYRYEKGNLDDYGFERNELEQYSYILKKAKLRVQEYAESRIYDKDGSAGAKFILDSAFNWVTKRDEAEISARKATTELERLKFELQKETLKGKEEDDSNLTVQIVRAKKGDSNE